LSTLLAQNTRQAAGIDSGKRDDAMLAEIIGQALLFAEIRIADRQVADNQPGRVYARRLDVFGIDADIADMRIGQGNDLARIAWVGQDFLVTGHRGIEHDLANRMAGGTDRIATKNRAVSERKQGGRKRRQHGKLLAGTPWLPTCRPSPARA